MSKKHLFVLPILIVGFLMLSQCRSRTSGPEIMTLVAGTVTDSVGALPVAGAEVYFQDTVAYTHPSLSDSAGHWEHYFLGGGPATYYCKKRGYETKSLTVHTDFAGRPIKNADFQLVQED